MARDGMANLLARLRGMIDDSGTAIWSDNQCQDILDAHKLRVQREALAAEVTYTGGTTYVYTTYHSRLGDYEEGGTAYFNIEAADGTQRGTADYTADYVRGHVVMDNDQAGTALYLTGWSYDLQGAAADLWRERAGKVSSYYNVTADGHNMSRSQWFTHCKDMAVMYATQARAVTVRQWRHGVEDDR